MAHHSIMEKNVETFTIEFNNRLYLVVPINIKAMINGGQTEFADESAVFKDHAKDILGEYYYMDQSYFKLELFDMNRPAMHIRRYEEGYVEDIDLEIEYTIV